MDKIKTFFASVWKWLKSVFVSVDEQPSLLKKYSKTNSFSMFLGTVTAVGCGLAAGLLIMLCISPLEAFQGLFVILWGSLNAGLKSIGDMLGAATVIAFTGLSVTFAFKTGLFNIGASGQFMFGIFASYYVAFHWTALGGVTWLVALLAGFVAGAMWGLVPGLFKALLNVNEVITSIMCNYIAMYVVDFLIKSDSVIFLSIQQRVGSIPEVSRIPALTFLSDKVNVSLFLAILAVVALSIIIRKTTFGYELKATGFNKHAAKYAGMNEKRNIILSLVIAGALAGIGGAIYAISGKNGAQYSPSNVISSQGFDGIAVALIGNTSPVGSFFAAIFIAHLRRGGFYVQGNYSFKPEVVELVIGIIVYFTAFSALMIQVLAKHRKNRLQSKALAESEKTDTTAQVDTQNDVNAKMEESEK